MQLSVEFRHPALHRAKLVQVPLVARGPGVHDIRDTHESAGQPGLFEECAVQVEAAGADKAMQDTLFVESVVAPNAQQLRINGSIRLTPEGRHRQARSTSRAASKART